jgi:hypothetical protein
MSANGRSFFTRMSMANLYPTGVRNMSDNRTHHGIYISLMKKKVLLSIILLSVLVSSPAMAVTGSHGELLSVSKVSGIKSGDTLTIKGQHFDETVGIYIAMCVIVKPESVPTPCGGGVDETGATGASAWISSNPPSYGKGLAKPYRAGGRFTVKLKVSPMIGKIDCRKVSCAIYVRADHTRGDDRSYDIFSPIKFIK